ncbi:class I SAM-dependent methyltransferase [Pontibacter oryzae]|uniref:Class I SAM-dependent methyltransferase n=1 Tax=Pontibacter oryzae TaxID=2304593 RepID=A0A399SFV1_9BACT|nr:class I SAM-dependent methyltransferase [Pontibacter oryzae]RIJ41699.1 class I SAM-dependent methyltransferase [Pontibacter oryzae]
MATPKDNFSAQAAAYAAFRPHYPKELYDFLYSLPGAKQAAWDCGTGNGQVAVELAEKYENVYATDISEAQLQRAPERANIKYILCQAEQTPLPAASVNIITVAQAVHWFDFEKFYTEVQRVARPDAWLAIWGYGLLQISPSIDPIINRFYFDIVGPYWDTERSYLDQKYTSIPLPFPEHPAPAFGIDLRWTLNHFMGYLSSWSAVKHYERKHGKSPLPDLQRQLQQVWPDNATQAIEFPIFMRLAAVC